VKDKEKLKSYLVFKQYQHKVQLNDSEVYYGDNSVLKTDDMINCDHDSIFKSFRMERRGFYSSACLNHSTNYLIENFEDSDYYKYISLRIERCNSSISSCAKSRDIDDFINYF
jgi:hypothetical protein